MSFTVRPGHVMKWLFWMALVKVGIGGLRHVAWRYWARSALDCHFLIITLACWLSTFFIYESILLRVSSLGFLWCNLGWRFGLVLLGIFGDWYFVLLLYRAGCVVGATIEISHKLSDKFLYPFSIKLSCLKTLRLSLSSSTLHPSSHNCPKDMRDELFSFGTMVASFALLDRAVDSGN